MASCAVVGPLRCLKEGCGLDVGSASTRSEASGFVFDQEFANDCFTETGVVRTRFSTHTGPNLLRYLRRARTLREGYLVPENVGKRCIAVLALERRSSIQHLVYQYTKGPPIDRTCVSTALDDFWRDVLLGTNKRVGSEVVYARFCVNSRQIV